MARIGDGAIDAASSQEVMRSNSHMNKRIKGCWVLRMSPLDARSATEATSRSYHSRGYVPTWGPRRDQKILNPNASNFATSWHVVGDQAVTRLKSRAPVLQGEGKTLSVHPRIPCAGLQPVGVIRCYSEY